MDCRLYSYRHGLDLMETVEQYRPLWYEIMGVLSGVTEERIASHFAEHHEGRSKSISATLNSLIDEDLTEAGWNRQSPIFAASEYGDRTWLLDFAKEVSVPTRHGTAYFDLPQDERSGISIEVAFNHGGNVAWNLIKPVIASEINHVEKRIQTGVGVVIAATDDMKSMGGFDGAVGSFEKYVSHLLPLRTMLTVPMVIIGLDACRSFRIRHETSGTSKRGFIEWNGGCTPLRLDL